MKANRKEQEENVQESPSGVQASRTQAWNLAFSRVPKGEDQ